MCRCSFCSISIKLTMDFKSYYASLDEMMVRNIRKDLNEDPERLERQVQLFKEWLKCEPHLPKDIDEQLIENFVRFCKCNLDRAKTKFENYLAARIKWRQPNLDPVFDEEYFWDSGKQTYRQCAVHPKLTPNGYRVSYYRLHRADEFNLEQTLRYSLTLIDLFLFESTSSGLIIIMDLDKFTTEHIPKVNLKLLLMWANLLINISPFRIRSIHFLNMPKIAETILNIVLKTFNKKVYERVFIHQGIEGLSKYLPDDILMEEYGGSGGKFEQYSELLRLCLIDNKDFVRKVASLKLAGPVPTNKSDLYSFEDFGMEGSFRQLNID